MQLGRLTLINLSLKSLSIKCRCRLYFKVINSVKNLQDYSHSSGSGAKMELNLKHVYVNNNQTQRNLRIINYSLILWFHIFKFNFDLDQTLNLNTFPSRIHRTERTRDSISTAAEQTSPNSTNLPNVHPIRPWKNEKIKWRMQEEWSLMVRFICLWYKHTGVSTRGCLCTLP